MKKLLNFSALLLLLLFVSCTDSDDEPIIDSGIETTADVYSPLYGTTLGTSTLVRKNDEISINFETHGLTPGYAYTLWWVVWNKPENCTVSGACTGGDLALSEEVEVELLYAAGSVADNSGKVNYTAKLREHEVSESINTSIGFSEFGGLQNASTAEIHMVLRSHGPAIPGMEDVQITEFKGGCTTAFPGFSEIPDETGECGNIQASIHIPK